MKREPALVLCMCSVRSAEGIVAIHGGEDVNNRQVHCLCGGSASTPTQSSDERNAIAVAATRAAADIVVPAALMRVIGRPPA